MPDLRDTAEGRRLAEDARRTRNWKRWGPYLAERQWGTVREDYSPHGTCWDYFTHDQSRSRAYRWGEDGILGLTDRECRLCFALALWNERDPILKERLFGLTGPEGNHGEDVKEQYFYLDSTPTHSYLKGLYKYPQREFPYARLVEAGRSRGRGEPELELNDTGVFDDDAYFDVLVEYAKGGPDDVVMRVTAANRGAEPAPLHLLPTLWFRNQWSWGRTDEGHGPRPRIWKTGEHEISVEHDSLGAFRLTCDDPATMLFTENDTNYERLYGSANQSPYVKDAFHERVIHGRNDAVNPAHTGTKAALWSRFVVPARGQVTMTLRLSNGPREDSNEAVLKARKQDADELYAALTPAGASDEEARVIRQGYAGLLWSKQFYHYVVAEWLEGDPAHPAPPASRQHAPNADWTHLHNRDIISMPDKWEYPWYAAWDLAFHMVPFAVIDPEFAKQQLLLFLREWYMHPNGQIPAYEFALGDVNPPVHAWACWRVYKLTGGRGHRDRGFLERVFTKLLFNFAWWVNRKDPLGHHIFSGGFLGLDNIGVFDRNRPLPTGGQLQQADGTAWMAFFCGTMLAIAMELARENPAYEDVASKFFEHFIAIVDAMNTLGGTGLWDEEDGFYYDHVLVDGVSLPLRIRSMVGLVPLFVVGTLEEGTLAQLPGFRKRMEWFIANRRDLQHTMRFEESPKRGRTHRQLAIPTRERLVRVLRYVLDENEFLSPHGVRSLSKVHQDQPFVLRLGAEEYRVDYTPGESTTALFGGNSNWRGPVWFPMNYLLIEALHRYHFFYGDSLRVECPTGSGVMMNLEQVALELARRQSALFLRGSDGKVPSHGDDPRFADNEHWKDLLLFYEHFHGDTGRGLGASHQTGWTALAVRYVDEMVRRRSGGGGGSY